MFARILSFKGQTLQTSAVSHPLTRIGLGWGDENSIISCFWRNAQVLQDYEADCWRDAPPFGHCRTGGTILSAMQLGGQYEMFLKSHGWDHSKKERMQF